MVDALEPRQMMSAGPVAVGPETRLNAFTTGTQMTPVVAMDAAGNYVAAWASYKQDGSGYGVFAQRYSAAGVAQGALIKVNTYTTGDQAYPSIAMDSSGAFVISWSSDKQDGSGYGIYAKRFNATGVAQGNEFKVNTYTTGSQNSSTVAIDNAGDFTIAWESDGQDGTVGGKQLTGIYAQRYNAAGVAQGSAFKVNAFTTKGNPLAPRIAMDGTGDFAVVWTSYYANMTSHCFAQRFSPTGVKQGSEFNVSTLITNLQYDASIGMNQAGKFVISWTNQLNFNADTSQIFAQRYNSSGVAQGAAFKVNSSITTYVDDSSVALDAAGDFVIAWDSYYQDGSYAGTYAQRFLAAGTAAGAEFKVNTYTSNFQWLPNVASDAGGDFIITWQSYDQDGDEYGVYAQRYSPPVNHAPVGTAKTVTTLEDAAYTFKTTDFGFTDPSDAPPNTLLSVKVTTLPTAGSLTDNGVAVAIGAKVPVADITAGKLKFAPAANANGAAYSSFTFQVQDNGGTAHGGVDIDATARKMTISVTPVNDAPTGAPKTVTTLEDTAYVFKTADFGFTDSKDSPANSLSTVKITTLPLKGMITDLGIAVAAGIRIPALDIALGRLKFVPAANGNGATYASFSFQVQDNGGTANGGVDTDPTARKMTISVTAVNDAPVGTAKTVSATKNVAYVFKVADFGFSDPNDVPANSLLAVKISTLPLLGSLTNNGVAVVAGSKISLADITAGKLKFTPAKNGSGAAYASFTFQVQDNGGIANGGTDTDITPRKMTISVS